MYTFKSLEADIAYLNTKLGEMDHPYRFGVDKYNGYTRLYRATPEQLERNLIASTLMGGSPKDCYHRALAYLVYFG